MPPAKLDDFIHLQALGELMGDEEHGYLPLELIDRSGEVFCRLLVEVAGGFVEDEHSGLFEQCPCNGDTLFLSAAESRPVFADLGLVALREFLDDVVYFGQLAGVDDLFEAGMGVGENEVVVDGAREQGGFLRHHAEVGTQFVGSEVADVASVKLDAALLRMVEGEQEFGEGALAGA